MSNMSPSMQQATQQIRQAWYQSPLPEFFSWWGQELRACLPRRLRSTFKQGAAWHLVSSAVGGWTIHATGSSQPLVRLDPTQDAATQKMEWQRALAKVDRHDLCLALCLPHDQVLRRTLHLPAAARANLRQVVSYDIDRQTPFRAADTFFDVRVLGKATAGKLRAELVVVPRAHIQPQLQALQAIGLHMHAVDVADGNTRLGVNLLPPEARARRARPCRRINLILLAVAVLLALGCMGQWLHNRRTAFADLQAQVDTLHGQAQTVASLRRQLITRLGAADFLSNKRTHSPRLIDVLADVTHRLPDDTWLERFSLDSAGDVSLQGQSPHATQLLKDIGGSPYLHDPGFKGVIQTDPRTGKERFYLSAELRMPKDKPAKSDQNVSNNQATDKEDAHAQTQAQ